MSIEGTVNSAIFGQSNTNTGSVVVAPVAVFLRVEPPRKQQNVKNGTGQNGLKTELSFLFPLILLRMER